MLSTLLPDNNKFLEISKSPSRYKIHYRQQSIVYQEHSGTCIVEKVFILLRC